jgi:hypothetical protein
MAIKDVMSPISSGSKTRTGHPGPQSTTRAESPGSRSHPSARGRTDQFEGRPPEPSLPPGGDRPAEIRGVGPRGEV